LFCLPTFDDDAVYLT